MVAEWPVRPPAVALDKRLYRRLGRRIDSELALWASADTVHMVVIATFGVSEAGTPAIGEMSLMPVTPQWLPIEDSFDRQLVEHLGADGRAFIKGLRYNLHRGECLASATLTDTRDAGSLIFVVSPGLDRTAVAVELIHHSCKRAVACPVDDLPQREGVLLVMSGVNDMVRLRRLQALAGRRRARDKPCSSEGNFGGADGLALTSIAHLCWLNRGGRHVTGSHRGAVQQGERRGAPKINQRMS